MSTIKGLRTLVRLKSRRAEQAEAALQQSIGAMQGEEAAHAEVTAAQEAALDAERARRDRLASATGEGHRFLGNDVVALQMLVEDAQARSADARRQTAQAAARVEAARGEVQRCRASLHRARQQLEDAQERLQQVLAAAERAQEDAQDEEAEETAAARMLAAARELRRSRVSAKSMGMAVG